MLTLRPYQTDILRDLHDTLKRGAKRPIVVAPCGAGKTVLLAWLAEQTQKKGNTVWFLVHRRELLDQTLDTFERFDIALDRIHVGMVGQVSRNLEKFPKPDMIVFDEAQHSVSATWTRIIDRYPDAWIIGLTATPSRLDGKPLGAIYDTLVLGPTTSELIDDGWLAPYRVVAVDTADLQGLGRRGQDYDMADAAIRLMERAVYGPVVDTFREYVGSSQAIYFCTTIEHSERTAAEFRAVGIRAVHFDGTTPKKQRKQIIEQFRAGEIQVLTNCELIGEGFDMPDCDAVGMLRPTASLGLYIQQTGRALRPKEGKVATIVDHVGNVQRHGFPSEDRAWSLDQTVQTGRRLNKDGSFAVRRCAECYAVYPSTSDACPVCGELYESTREEIRSIEKVKMRVLEMEHAKRERNWALSDEAVMEARSYSALCTIARHRGYKTGWAYRIAKARGLWVPY